MRTLKQHLKGSIESVTESFNNLKVYCVGRGEGPVVICKEYPTQDPYSEDDTDDFDIKNTDWLFTDIEAGTGNLAVVEWNDEYIDGSVLDKVHNERDLRKDFDKNVGKWLEDNKAYVEDEGERYIEIYVELDCGAAFDCANDRDDFQDFSLDYLWDCWMTQFNDSFVDGDSSYCRCLVDLKKKKVIAGGADIDFDI